MAGISDTAPEAERVLTEVYRRMTPAQKWRQLGQMYQDARALHAAGLRATRPDITPGEVTDDWIRRNLAVALPVPSRATQRSYPMANLQNFTEVTAIFDR